MKCPKCHYLSFDPEPRCRNCGFSLGLDADLPIATAGSHAPPADLELQPPQASTVVSADGPTDGLAATAAAGAERRPRPVRRIPTAARPVAASPVESIGDVARHARPGESASLRVAPATSELPLFVKEMIESPVSVDVDEPAQVIGAPPGNVAPSTSLPGRAVEVEEAHDPGEVPVPPGPSPIAPMRPEPVARAAAAPVATGPVSDAERVVPMVAERAPMWRATSTPRTLGPLDHDLLKDLDALTKREGERAAAAREAEERRRTVAGTGRRLAAAVLDGLVLTSVLAGLLAVTLRWTALTLDDVLALPMWPLAAFLILVAYGYLLLFTAATGQTPGKMAAGIRVVDAGSAGDRSDPLKVGQACVRELIALPAILAFGLGFLPALVGDARGLHDRVAATRVVRE